MFFNCPIKAIQQPVRHYEYRNKYSLDWKTKNGKKGLFETFKQQLKVFRSNHPMVRYLDATRASDIVKDWRYSYFTHKEEGSDYVVEGDNRTTNSEKQYWFLYVDKNNEKIIDQALNQEQVKYDKTHLLNGSLYSIATNASYLKLPNLRLKSKEAKMPNKTAVETTFKSRTQYEKDKKTILPLMSISGALYCGK